MSRHRFDLVVLQELTCHVQNSCIWWQLIAGLRVKLVLKCIFQHFRKTGMETTESLLSGFIHRLKHS